MENNYFTELNAIDVNGHTEKKNGLTYLSWAWAWGELKKVYPEAKYKVVKNENGLPYFYDENTGYMVFTEMTIGDITHEMWLPVMDGANKAMKSSSYKVVSKFGEKVVEPATMFDINKTIMRCLVKNIAMFGLGLYIYAGEDLPEQAVDNNFITQEQIAELKKLGVDEARMCVKFNVSSIDKMTFNQAQQAIALKTATNTFPDAKVSIKKEV